MKQKAAKKSGKVTGKTTGVTTVPPLIPQKHGGALRAGGTPGNAGGFGRPRDEVRAKYLELGATKGFEFISELLDGKLATYLIGKCEKCRHEQGFDAETVEYLMEQIKVSVDHRLKANEQAMKYGTQQQKELVIADMPSAEAFFNCISAAAVELFGVEGSEALKARSKALMEAKK